MRTSSAPLFDFEHTFARDLDDLAVAWQAAPSPAPTLVVLNEELAEELGLDPESLRSPEGVDLLVGNTVVEGSSPVAQAYSGHQFGGYSPRLGDGRALLLGELIDRAGRRRDLHLKGSGRTPFARGGDGRAVLGPMLREWVIGEAMHGLGIPTTRALAVVATGEDVPRERLLPGAVLARVAASHLRVGTFQYAAATGGPELVRRVADYAIDRHHPAARDADDPYLALFDAVLDAQASLVARWMQVGFIHGVMNTDNTTISGETIDYGPCAFMDVFEPATVYSSIDHGGRYAYGNQPRIVQWNLARLAESMLTLFDDDPDTAVARASERIGAFPSRYDAHLLEGMSAKLGMVGRREGDDEIVDGWLGLLHTQRVDMTSAFRSLSAAVRAEADPFRSLFSEPAALQRWSERWLARLGDQDRSPDETAAAMDAVNPIYVPRNHRVEAALDAATHGDLEPVRRLVDAVSRPFEERPDHAAEAEPAPADFVDYQTFCGT